MGPHVALPGKHWKIRHLRAIIFQGRRRWECHGTAHMVQVQPCLSNKDINSELLRHQRPAAGALLEDGRLLNLGLASPRTPLTTRPFAGGVSGFAGPRHLDFTRKFGRFPGLGPWDFNERAIAAIPWSWAGHVGLRSPSNLA